MRSGRYLGGLLTYTHSAMRRYDIAVTPRVVFTQWGHHQWCFYWRFWE